MQQVVEWLRSLFRQVRAFLASMPGYQRVTFLGVLLGFVGAFAAFVWWASRPIYDNVFTNLGQPDAAAIVEYLQKERIPYRLEQGGSAVLVPANQVYDVRLALASAGLPQGGGVGFEIFDQQKLGMTDFLQRLNYSRALQGELGRTISQIAGVGSARVHLAIPERSLFVSEDQRPTASVILTLAPGRALGASSIAGIVHLVASSVPGLAPDDISVVDNAGRVLAGNEGDLEEAGIGGGVREHQRKIEADMEERIESMLGRVVGREKVNARVNVVLNMTRVDTTEERIDPDQTAVRSERLSREESTDSRAAPGGVPGVTANLTNETAPATSGSRSQRRDETITYEISKVTRRILAAAGQVERLSVAVLVDGTYAEQGGETVFVPRSQEDLDRYSELVKNAVGFTESRGDTVEIASVQFKVPEEIEVGWSTTLAGIGRSAATYLPRLMGLALIIVAVLFVIRPALASLASQSRIRVAAGDTSPTAIDVENLMERLGHENRRLTTEDPERAAYLIRTWLAQRE